MTRYIILGNGILTVLADSTYKFRELYYPLSTHNHLDSSRIGLFKNNEFRWIHDLNPSIEYLEDTLTSKVRVSFNNLELEIYDTVDLAYEILVRKVNAKTDSETRIFFTWDFHINESPIGDTCLYDPNENGIIHYKRDKWFLFSCDLPIFQYATGYKEEEGYVGTWKDCEDGELSGNPIAQGSVDSAMSIKINSNTTFYCWLVCGNCYSDLKKRNEYVKKRGPDKILDRTSAYWKAWLTKISDFDSFTKRSALVLASSWQNNGAIPASLDTDILRFNRDTYNYVWHRDAAFCAIAFSLLNYQEYPRRLFTFTKPLLHNGFLFQKFTVDGHWGSTWHPWLMKKIPIQEDETALILYALWIYFKKFMDIEYIKELYRPFIKSIADFLIEFTDQETGLPLPSYDLWEERYGIHFYTAATVYAGLKSASNFASFFGEYDLAKKYSKAASRLKDSMSLFFSDGHFARSLVNDKLDLTADASTILGALLVYEPNDEKVIENRKYIEERLNVGGIARYEGDSYLKEFNIPNAWFITTCWLAQQYIAEGNLEKGKECIKWVIEKSLPTGLIPEQISKNMRYPSVSPLSWSHAELLRASYYLRYGYNNFI